MSDPSDEEALIWAGDDELRAPRGPARRLIDDGPPAAGRPGSGCPGSGHSVWGGGVSLVALGVLGGVALLETAFWIRSALQLAIASSIDTGGGTPIEIVSFAVNVAGRILAVLAPVVWFAVAATRVAVPSRRLALLVLGALVLVPWPAILAAS